MDLDEIINRLAELPDLKRKTAIAEAVAATKQYKWVPNPGPQSEAYVSEADELFYGGSAGGGKGIRLTDKVLTPFGWRAAGDMREGSALCAIDGSVQRIIKVFRRGVQPLFKLTWSDGATSVCDADHIWLGWDTSTGRKLRNKLTHGAASARKWVTSDIFKTFQRTRAAKRPFRLSIPTLEKPCVFNVAGENKGRGVHVGREVPAYILGVLLGDGSLTQRVRFTTEDAEIVERVNSVLKTEVSLELSHSASAGRCPEYSIPVAAKYRETLKNLGLWGKLSFEKHIPRIYLLSPVEERWELLQGLMDTDGWADLDGDCYYSTTSPRLRDDVKHLARSLGALVSHAVKHPRYAGADGTTMRGREAYTLRIKMRRPERMFTLDRKRERCAGKVPQSMGRFLEDIQPYGEGETVCFVVSHPSSLFILEDFVVTHNTDLVLGLALSRHKRSLILRRTHKESLGIVDRMTEIMGNRNGYNSHTGAWRLSDRIIEIGGCQLEEDKQKFKGIPHDLKAFDEVSDFSRSQYEFITAWNRTTEPGQRCRIVCTGNPPTTPEGLWVLERWAAWLDPQHTNPAKAGELRWYLRNGDEEIEVGGRGPHMIDGRAILARSRTFVPATLNDNPDLRTTDYQATLDALPEDLRKAYRDGIFTTALRDDAFQTIPTAWVKDAQARWSVAPPIGVPLCAIGVDVAQGGVDQTVLAKRHDYWFAPLVIVPGASTPDGKAVSGLVIQHRRDNAKVVIDIGGGWGGDALQHLTINGIDAVGYMGVKTSGRRTVDNALKFKNVRTEAYWRFREALDPSQLGGAAIALPPDNILVADLCAPKYHVGAQGIELEAKDKVCDRLGRSTDRGDAVVMAWWQGAHRANIKGGSFRSMQELPDMTVTKKPWR